MEYIIHRGDQLNLSFPIIMENYILTEDMITTTDLNRRGDVEILIGYDIRKTYNNNEVYFNKITNTFDCILTQEDTFNLCGGTRLRSQIRIKLNKLDNFNNLIYTYEGPDVIVKESLSTEIL